MLTNKVIYIISVIVAIIGAFLTAANDYIPAVAAMWPNASHAGPIIIATAVFLKTFLQLVANQLGHINIDPPKIILFFGFIVATLQLTACSTPPTPQQQAILSDVYNTVITGAVNAGTAYLTGNSGQAVAQAAFTAVKTGGDIAQLVSDTIKAKGGTTAQAATVNTAINSALTLAQPQTKTQKVTVYNTIGAALQTLANQNFATNATISHQS